MYTCEDITSVWVPSDATPHVLLLSQGSCHSGGRHRGAACQAASAIKADDTTAGVIQWFICRSCARATSPHSCTWLNHTCVSLKTKGSLHIWRASVNHNYQGKLFFPSFNSKLSNVTHVLYLHHQENEKEKTQQNSSVFHWSLYKLPVILTCEFCGSHRETRL